MQDQATHASGHVFCVERKRGPQWYCKFRVSEKQVQKRLGPAWIVGGPPPDGYFTKKTAEAELAAILTDACRGALPGLPVVGATVRDAAEGWLRHGECERGIKASTASEYRNVVNAHIVPRFGDWPVGNDQWADGHFLTRSCGTRAAGRSTKRRSAMRLLSVHRRRPIRSVLARSGKSKSAVRRRRPPHVGLVSA